MRGLEFVVSSWALVLFSVVFTTQGAWAQTTTVNAADAAASLIAAHGAFHQTQHHLSECRCRQFGHGCGGDFGACMTHCEQCDSPESIVVTPQASNIAVVSYSALQFDAPPERTELPQSFVSSAYVFQNCSKAVAVTENETTSVAFQRSSSSTVTKGLAVANGMSLQAQWKPTDSFSLTGGITVTSTATTSTATTDASQTGVTRSHGVNAQIPPRTAFGIGVKTWPVTYKTNFHVTVTVDADISQNNEGITRLSQIATPAQRTFDVTGTIGFTDAADGEGTDWDVDFDPEKCPAGLGSVVKISVPYPKTPSKDRHIAAPRSMQ
jgi:hypothetical protein